MMKRLLAAALLTTIAVGSVARASTPDDAWVARFIDKVTNPKVFEVTQQTGPTYFGDVLHFVAVGHEACALSFKAVETWPTLSFSALDFGDHKSCASSPLQDVQIVLAGDGAPEVQSVLEAVGKKLGKPTLEHVDPKTNAAQANWGTRHHGIIVEYDAGNPRGFTLWVLGPGNTARR